MPVAFIAYSLVKATFLAKSLRKDTMRCFLSQPHYESGLSCQSICHLFGRRGTGRCGNFRSLRKKPVGHSPLGLLNVNFPIVFATVFRGGPQTNTSCGVLCIRKRSPRRSRSPQAGPQGLPTRIVHLSPLSVSPFQSTKEIRNSSCCILKRLFVLADKICELVCSGITNVKTPARVPSPSATTPVSVVCERR